VRFDETKGKLMWVYDGEEWIDDDAADQTSVRRSEVPRPRYDEMMPELQVIEIVPVPRPRESDVPPLPLPTT
jgi:hypothetical protein